MTARLRELAARRDSLIVEAQMQREHLAQSAQTIQRRLALGEHALRWLRAAQRKRVLIAAGTAAAAMLIARPARSVKWVGYLYSAYSLVRTLTNLFTQTSRHR